jgi:OOP family OmpA-OmpF porin
MKPRFHEYLFFGNQPSLVLAIAGLLISLTGCSSSEMLIKVPTSSDSATIAPYDISTHKRSIHLFNPVRLEQKITQQKLMPRVRNLFVLIDDSSYMNQDYRGLSRRDHARETLRRFNHTLPAIGLNGHVYVLAGNRWFTNSADMETIELPEYDADQIERDLDEGRYDRSVGTGSLATAIDDLTGHIISADGASALVLITSWESIDSAAEDAVARLRQRSQHGAGFTVTNTTNAWQGKKSTDVCVYTIGIGNTFSRTRFDRADACGFSVASDKIAQPRDMSHFIERILFFGPSDTDGDGIYDYLDKCPDTKAGRLVRFDGCYRFGAMNEMALQGEQTRIKSSRQ